MCSVFQSNVAAYPFRHVLTVTIYISLEDNTNRGDKI